MEILYSFEIKDTEKERICPLVKEFYDLCRPAENEINLFKDKATNAIFCECHIYAQKLIELCTIDVPLDPDEQPEYRSNREIDQDNAAFIQMKEDAKKGRVFSNIVAEYIVDFDASHPIKIIGGQHRIEAIRDALGVSNEYQGVKIYFDLNMDQRLDVQLISNTNIDVSPDLLDRMMETVKGPELRNWCQTVGLLSKDSDFSDKKQRGNSVTVREARTFILNYYLGLQVRNFSEEKTDGILAGSGGVSADWEQLKENNPDWNKNKELIEAGKQYARLIEKQHEYFGKSRAKNSKSFAAKVHNYAVLAAWAFTSGQLQSNPTRLKRHYSLPENTNKDPLNAAVLASARHKSDPENYRGLGTRTDAKERGRLIELFNLQAETGKGIDKKMVTLALSKYFAKQANLEVKEIEES